MTLDVECDDGNIINDDGCSDQCRIEDGFSCEFIDSGETSVCKLTVSPQVEDVVISKDPSKNVLYFEFDIEPDTDVYNDYDLINVLSLNGADIDIQKAYYQDGKIMI